MGLHRRGLSYIWIGPGHWAELDLDARPVLHLDLYYYRGLHLDVSTLLRSVLYLCLSKLQRPMLHLGE
jgi:hypothetical protein